jgi:hypothetical protein
MKLIKIVALNLQISIRGRNLHLIAICVCFGGVGKSQYRIFFEPLSFVRQKAANSICHVFACAPTDSLTKETRKEGTNQAKS